eukprot:15123762-Alexandrium_andersonii.AAC.1
MSQPSFTLSTTGPRQRPQLHWSNEMTRFGAYGGSCMRTPRRRSRRPAPQWQLQTASTIWMCGS